mmetsp:Transcript_100307/g.309436  ORF Transcript_100307/g.309436 Transcript_100307/m.309436 type:complete len:106 (+) Transcript_100307:217-534(+)
MSSRVGSAVSAPSAAFAEEALRGSASDSWPAPALPTTSLVEALRREPSPRPSTVETRRVLIVDVLDARPRSALLLISATNLRLEAAFVQHMSKEEEVSHTGMIVS